MKPMTMPKIGFALCCGAMLGVACAQSANNVTDKEMNSANVRVYRHEDGSKDVLERTKDARTLIKRTYSAEGKPTLVTVYTTDAAGNAMSCKIYDSAKNELFKVRYGYRKSDGQLVEEQMFDSRAKHLNPIDGKEMPVRRFIYTYDANGNRSKPMAITLTAGKSAEQVFGAAPSALEKNPFDTANPNAKSTKSK